MDLEAGEFAAFVETRQRALQRTAWLLSGDRAMAKDLVQTALARTWRRRRWHSEQAVELVPDSAAPSGSKNGWIDRGRLVPLKPIAGDNVGDELW